MFDSEKTPKFRRVGGREDQFIGCATFCLIMATSRHAPRELPPRRAPQRALLKLPPKFCQLAHALICIAGKIASGLNVATTGRDQLRRPAR
jgi:hypothetical protein